MTAQPHSPTNPPDTIGAPDPVPTWQSWFGEDPEADTDPAATGGDDLSPANSTLLDSDPMAPIVAEMRRSRAVRRRRRTTVTAIGSAATTAAVAVGGWLVLADHAGTSTAGVVPTPSIVTVVGTTPATPWCAATNTASLTIGAGPGALTSASGVILWQQNAMYVRRDADAVRSVLAPDALAASPESTRAAIDAIPAGTRHCVTITPAGPDRWAVQIAEQRPDGSQPRWQQLVTTARQSDGRFLITAITPED